MDIFLNCVSNSPASHKRSCTNLAESQLTVAMPKRKTRRETTPTEFSVTMVTRLIPSSVLHVTGTGSPHFQRRGCYSDMASSTLCQKCLRTDCPSPSPLHFCQSSQTDQVNSGNASKCVGPFANTAAAEPSVPCPTLLS